jgi:TIR domain
MPMRDVFICHASADKDTYARPLAAALSRRAVSVWLDEAEIRPGTSIVDAINDGLRYARFVTPILTEEFIGRDWPRRELNAAFIKEVATRRVVVLPILAVDQDLFFTRYPLLSDKLYLNWANGVERVAQEISELFGRSAALEWHYDHPHDHVGIVWVTVLHQPANASVQHRLTLRWGAYIRHVAWTPGGVEPISFIHHKTNPDLVTLHASIEPAAIVTFGQGQPPRGQVRNIDEGWTRTSGGEWPGNL